MVYIYGLFCPVARAIRYIGKSISPVNRLAAHINVAKTGRGKNHAARWICRLLKARLLPELRILEEVTEEEWKGAERRWIAKARAAGWALTNATDGGDAFPTLDSATRAAMAAKMAASMRKAWANPIKRARLMEALHSPETKRKRSQSVRRYMDQPGNRERHSAVMKSICSTALKRAESSARTKKMLADPERNARRIDAIRHAYQNPQVKEKHAAANRLNATPERRAAISLCIKALWQDPEYRAKLHKPQAREKMSAKRRLFWVEHSDLMKARMNDPARVAKIAVAMRKKNADPFFRAKLNTPEVRAKRAAAIKASWARRKASLNIANYS